MYLKYARTVILYIPIKGILQILFIKYSFELNAKKSISFFIWNDIMLYLCSDKKFFFLFSRLCFFRNYVSSYMYMFSYWNLKFFSSFVQCVSIWLVINLWYTHLALLPFKGRYMNYILRNTKYFAEMFIFLLLFLAFFGRSCVY